ncbi:MAG: CpXC domain-containing protein [bacterium]
MTRRLGEKVECIYCGKKFLTDYYASVNVSMDADLKKEIVLERMNQADCPHCKKSFVLNLNPFVYYDMNRRRYIFVYGKDKENDEDAIKREVKEFSQKFKQPYASAHGSTRADEITKQQEILFGMDTLAFEIAQHDHDPSFRYAIDQGMKFEDEEKREIIVVANYPCQDVIHIKAVVGKKQLGYATLLMENYSDLSKQATAVKTIASEVIIDPIRDTVSDKAIKNALQKYIKHINEKMVM